MLFGVWLGFCWWGKVGLVEIFTAEPPHGGGAGRTRGHGGAGVG